MPDSEAYDFGTCGGTSVHDHDHDAQSLYLLAVPGLFNMCAMYVT